MGKKKTASKNGHRPQKDKHKGPDSALRRTKILRGTAPRKSQERGGGVKKEGIKKNQEQPASKFQERPKN